jgi:hypothetical protein
MYLTTLTLVHVVVSLLGIFSGFIVVFGLLTDKRLDGWTALFLGTTVATSVTGFFFPVDHFMPSHAVGMLSLLALAVAIYARYARHLSGRWRKSYVITAVVAFYFNVFVGIVQAFEKIPALKVLAPTQSEAPFKVTQLVVLAIFVALAALSAIRFHDRSVLAAPTHPTR